VAVHLRELLAERKQAKDDSRSLLIRTIMAKSVSQTYLSRRTGLSAATVSTIVREFAEKRWVKVTQVRNESHVEIAQTTGAAVGVELGFRHAAVVARRAEHGYEDAKIELRKVGAALGSSRWLPGVTEAIRDAVGELGEEEIAAIGLAVPRVVNPHNGKLMPPALPPWNAGEDPAAMLFDELRTGGKVRIVAPSVVLDNDANLAAFAESVYAFPDAEILIGIKASTGIGAGIVIGGKKFRGAIGVAGEIGHLVVEQGGKFCSCGGRGCLETIIGADALVEQAKTVLAGQKLSTYDELADLVQKAVQGNVACRRVLEEAARTLGSAIGNLCNMLNPNVVVLGGAFGREDAVNFTLAPCREALERSAMRSAVKGDGFKLEPSQVKHAAAHGALMVAFEGTSYVAA
jgi:predicted NBD/HSP70 family sugar kinase